MNPKPFSDSYWVVPGEFLAGGYPFSSLRDPGDNPTLRAFLDAGFNTFFDLTDPGELPAYLTDLMEEAAHLGVSIHYQRFQVQDRGLPTRANMRLLLDALDASLSAGEKLYLHCWGGIGRTGTAVGCWLVRHGLTGGQALIRLNELYRTSGQSRLFPRSPETDAQIKFILDWMEADGLA